MSQAEHSFAYEFGEWLVEPDLNRIRREAGQAIQLEPRTMEVLRYLLEHPNEVVSTDELLATVWAGRVVEDNAVHRNISRIRRHLGDSSRNPQYIETITKRGCRTIAPVRKFEAAPADSDLQTALEAVTPPYAAYDGDEPFTFICYSHQNREPVYRELRRLREAGINVWYDEGISPGAEWTEEVANAVANCTHLLFFLSPNSVASKHCLDEVHVAQTHEKSIVVVYLEPTDLPLQLELSIGRIQALFLHSMPRNEYARKLIATLSAMPGRDPQAGGPTRSPTSAPIRTGSQIQPPNRFRKRAIAAAAAGALVVSISVLILRPKTISIPFLPDPVPENSIIISRFEDFTPSHNAEWIGGSIVSDIQVKLPDLGFQVVGSNAFDGAEVIQTSSAALRLTGSVTRGIGGSIKVTIALFSTDNNHQMYAKVYDLQGDDDQVVQAQIAGQMAIDLARVVGEEQPALLANLPDETPTTGILNRQPALPTFPNFDEPDGSSPPVPQFQQFDDFESSDEFEDVDDGFEEFDFDNAGGSDE